MRPGELSKVTQLPHGRGRVRTQAFSSRVLAYNHYPILPPLGLSLALSLPTMILSVLPAPGTARSTCGMNFWIRWPYPLGSSGGTQRQGSRIKDFLESSGSGGQSRRWDMRAEDPRLGHAHVYLDWCLHQCMVSSSQCALNTRHPSSFPSPSSVLSRIPYSNNANHPPSSANLPGCLTLLPGLA